MHTATYMELLVLIQSGAYTYSQTSAFYNADCPWLCEGRTFTHNIKTLMTSSIH